MWVHRGKLVRITGCARTRLWLLPKAFTFWQVLELQPPLDFCFNSLITLCNNYNHYPPTGNTLYKIGHCGNTQTVASFPGPRQASASSVSHLQNGTGTRLHWLCVRWSYLYYSVIFGGQWEVDVYHLHSSTYSFHGSQFQGTLWQPLTMHSHTPCALALTQLMLQL